MARKRGIMKVILLMFFSIICPFLGMFIAKIVEGYIDWTNSFTAIINYTFGYVFGGIYFFSLVLIIAKFGDLMK